MQTTNTMKEDWTKQIAKRAAEHRSKAPDGLLDDVRKEMERRGLSIETPQRHKTLPLWTPRRTAVAVAATALALAIPVTWIELKKHADSPQIAANDSHTQTINHQPKTALRPSAANALQVHWLQPMDSRALLHQSHGSSPHKTQPPATEC